MFRSISRFSLHNIRRGPSTRAFHRITTDFIKHDTTGKLFTEKVGVIIGDPDEPYILVGPEISLAFRALLLRLFKIDTSFYSSMIHAISDLVEYTHARTVQLALRLYQNPQVIPVSTSRTRCPARQS